VEGCSEVLSPVVDEYRALVRRPARNGHAFVTANDEEIECLLAERAEWTPNAAEHLVKLARGYGSFMLRNAYALSLAMGIEDGDHGF